MTNRPILAGVIGAPATHSLSPLIHTVWAHRANINGVYVPINAPDHYEGFVKTMTACKAVGFAGVNVTMPHKTHALRYADEASEHARQAGAANMITFKNNGAYGDNSDIEGFYCSVEAAGGLNKGAAALILGAGGAARAVVLALKRSGLRDIFVANRTKEKAQMLASAFSTKTISWGERNDAVSQADIIVNATSLGMTGEPPLGLNLANAKPSVIIADIVYAPLETELLRAARARTLTVIDGLSMLMRQAAPGFRAWYGGEAKVDAALRKTLIDAIARKEAA